MSLIDEYREGGEGFGKWADENAWVKIYPMGSVLPKWMPLGELPSDEDEYGRSYKKMWDAQKDLLKEALVMENGRFKNALIILCWQRGEGKSLLACLIQLWKYFCWPSQQIMLGANSKDQIKFVHYDIMRDIIYHSPTLLQIVGEKNIQEKEIRLLDGQDNVASIIRSISSFTGIVSNISGYTFSEMFAMKKFDFFTQLDGSVRNIPNAMGVIDSTVSSKQHILYQLYTNQKKIKNLFFSYRYSSSGSPNDYWNPNMTYDQIEAYREKFPFGEFEKYFLNLWSAGTEKVFTQEMIDAINYFGLNGALGSNVDIMEVIGRKYHVLSTIEKIGKVAEVMTSYAGPMVGNEKYLTEIETLEKTLWPVDAVYQLGVHGSPAMAFAGDLEKLGDIYDTNWAIIGGIDRADPMKTRSSARTILDFMAKGLPGSRSNPFVFDAESAVPHYIYLLLHMVSVSDHSLEAIKKVILDVDREFNGVDMICGERWGVWDLAAWCDENDIKFETVHPSYDKQKAAFSEFYLAVKSGRFKTPPILIPGYKIPDILKEEMSIFDHDSDKRDFGSPEKHEKGGIQDDVIFSIGWGMFGGKNLNLDSFRERKPKRSFGLFITEKEKMYGSL